MTSEAEIRVYLRNLVSSYGFDRKAFSFLDSMSYQIIRMNPILKGCCGFRVSRVDDDEKVFEFTKLKEHLEHCCDVAVKYRNPICALSILDEVTSKIDSMAGVYGFVFNLSEYYNGDGIGDRTLRIKVLESKLEDALSKPLKFVV